MSARDEIARLEEAMGRQIVGQKPFIQRLLIALLCDGHVLAEGAPGLAKTRAVKVLGEAIEGDFHRLQFTPDLLPADLTGTEVFRPQEATFHFQAGPLFHNLILADEVNRAPAKVQSALLEAMAERQITVGSVTYPLPSLFLVMATQNPIEQEGTYPLPEAQLDRFLLHIRVDYPDHQEEQAIMRLARSEAMRLGEGQVERSVQISQDAIFAARREVLELHLADALERYIVSLVHATREPGTYGEDLSGAIQYGASPRASIGLDRCARAHAWLSGRDYVSPQDIQEMAADVLRHRVILSFEAEAEGLSADAVVARLLDRVAVP
jgi:MoxR-like ATPase